MCRPAAWVFLSMCIVSLCSCAAECDPASSVNCRFDRKGDSVYCGWTLGGDFILNTTSGGYIQLPREAENGSLKRKNVCSTEQKEYCYRFTYRFEAVDKINLSVAIIDSLDDSKELLLWRLLAAEPNIWHEASVPITTNNSFKIVFRAARLSGECTSKQSVCIDNLRYAIELNCELKPPHASPTYVATTPVSGTTTNASPETILSEQTVTGTISEQTSLPQTSVATKIYSRTNTDLSSEATTSDQTVTQTATHESPSSSHGQSGAHETPTTGVNSVSPQPGDENDRGTESSNKLRIIIGVVVGVIVIIILILILLLLLRRRKRRNGWKANNAQSFDGRHHSSTPPPMQPPNNLEINGNPDDPQSSAMPEYAVVNKPRKAKQDNPRQSSYEANGEDTAQHPAQHSEPRQETDSTSRHGNYSLARNPDPRTVHNSLYHVPRGDPAAAAFSQDLGEEYNMLDFQGKRLPAEGASVLVENEEAANAVYNRLNEGSDDTYNEVDRQRKVEVLGDVYSHISHL